MQEEAGHRETEEVAVQEELMPGCCCPVLVLHAQQHLGISQEDVHLVKSRDSA